MPAEPRERTAFDTNVLLYLIGADATKAARAKALLRGGGHISVQLLAEFTAVARRKTTLSWAALEEILAAIERACIVHPLTLDIHRAARLLSSRDRLAIYDAQIVASALSCDATVLWTEDLQDGRVFDNRLTIRNPFVSLET